MDNNEPILVEIYDVVVTMTPKQLEIYEKTGCSKWQTVIFVVFQRNVEPN